MHKNVVTFNQHELFLKMQILNTMTLSAASSHIRAVNGKEMFGLTRTGFFKPEPDLKPNLSARMNQISKTSR